VRLPLAVFLCVLSPAIALGQGGFAFISGNTLYERCVPGASDTANSFCIGYVTGVADVLMQLHTVCLPSGVEIGQLVDVVTKHLRDHPEVRHYQANNEIGIVLGTTFPCQRRNAH
jgi:hypothetical protein